MDFLRRKFACLGILILAFSISACLEETKAVITPSDGATDVPVNTILRVSYTGNSWIRGSAMRNSKNFRLEVCGEVSDPTTTTSLEDKDEKSSEDNKEKKKSTTTPARSNVAGRIFQQQRKYNVERTYEKTNEVDWLKRHDVIFVPILQDSEDTPLQEDTDYCFTVADLKNEKGKLIPGGNVRFHTEKEADFIFEEPLRPLNAEWIPAGTKTGDRQEMSPNQLLVIRFENPVYPTYLEWGLRLCRVGHEGPSQDDTLASDEEDSNLSQNDKKVWVNDSSDLCSPRGRSVSRDLSLVESLPVPDKVIQAEYRTFAIGSLFEPNAEYFLQIRLSPDTPKRQDPQVHIAPEVSFRIKEEVPKTTVQDLLADEIPMPCSFPSREIREPAEQEKIRSLPYGHDNLAR